MEQYRQGTVPTVHIALQCSVKLNVLLKIKFWFKDRSMYLILFLKCCFAMLTKIDFKLMTMCWNLDDDAVVVVVVEEAHYETTHYQCTVD